MCAVTCMAAYGISSEPSGLLLASGANPGMMAAPTQQNAQLLHLAGLAGDAQCPSSVVMTWLAATWLVAGASSAAHSIDDAAAKPCKGIASSNSQTSNVLKDFILGRV